MPIIAGSELTKEQHIKLFSNPVSGIATRLEKTKKYDDGARYYLANIRYSKSMVLNALDFWYKQFMSFYDKLRRTCNINPIFDMDFDYEKIRKDNAKIILNVSKLPNTFLFSHGYIHARDSKENNRAMKRQLHLLGEKYPFLAPYIAKNKIGFQERTMEMFFGIQLFNNKLIVAVFPNYHPFIPKDKIKAIGVTKQDNVFAIFDKNGGKKK